MKRVPKLNVLEEDLAVEETGAAENGLAAADEGGKDKAASTPSARLR